MPVTEAPQSEGCAREGVRVTQECDTQAPISTRQRYLMPVKVNKGSPVVSPSFGALHFLPFCLLSVYCFFHRQSHTATVVQVMPAHMTEDDFHNYGEHCIIKRNKFWFKGHVL
jgi:hypothetical protein